ncbi:hypothetical protein LTR53_006139 [Teratosphaeriaceae sp. CCFEE 6253]|nr:hypothetical protein LTR53_006139 [Teratosphaeriaceae sp. CCFEE 6253]
MCGYASASLPTDFILPGPSIGEELAERYTIKIEEIGPVSLRQIHAALLGRPPYVCGSDAPPFETERLSMLCPFDYTAWLTDSPPSIDTNCPALTGLMDLESYSPICDQSWSNFDSATVSPLPDILAPELFLESPDMVHPPFDDSVLTPRSSYLQLPPQLSPETALPFEIGGSYDPCSTRADISSYTLSSRARSSSGDLGQENDEPRFVCSECHTTFPTYYTLESHARSTTHRAYACPEAGCHSAYHRRDVFVRHLKTHRESGLHLCKICERNHHRKAFKRKDHLSAHIQQLHPGESVKEASGKTPPNASSPTSSHLSPAAPVCRGGSATLVGERVKTTLAKQRGMCVVKP